jgi:hypothetical protein
MAEANPDPAERKRRRQEYVRQWHAENRDRVREHKRKYLEANRDKIREQQQQYRDANRDRINEGHRQRYDPEYFRRYREANLGKISEQQQEYYQANRQERLKAVRAYNRGPDFDVTWAAMWDAQQGRCYLCERPMTPAEAFMDHWHGCTGHGGPKRSCRYCRRGLAHPKCNSLIGFIGDDPAILRIIADNLERANADIKARQAVMPQHITLF